jgi:DNA-directed RNA polymerase specialized sigma24 family protein
MEEIKLSTVKEREAFFIALYKKTFPVVARYVAKMGGSLEEAQDVFQDALVIYYEKVTATEASIIANEKAYLTGIAKNLWLQRYKTGGKTRPLHDFDIEVTSYKQPCSNKVLHYLETAGKKCMELLKAYYYDHLSVDTVAVQFGYSGIRSATVAKYKCLEKVRETVKQNSVQYADFIE